MKKIERDNKKHCVRLLAHCKNSKKGEMLRFHKDDLRKVASFFAEDSDVGPPSDEEVERAITIYNPTKPICSDKMKCLAVRVEPRKSEHNSKVMIFEDKDNDGIWKLLDQGPVFGLQDPFIIQDVQGWHIIGGVRVYPEKSTGKLGYETVFYRYKKNVFELYDEKNNLVAPFAVGPKKMKDIRLIDLRNGKIGVFTRPQGGEFGLGKIGYVEIDSLDGLELAIPRAKIIEGLFTEEEWGGANELHLLSDGNIGVLGHIAHKENEIKHYYSFSFVYNPINHTFSHEKVISTADDFPHVDSKHDLLGRVLFSGGLERYDNGTAHLYTGIGDTAAGRILINDPFAV